MSLEAARELAAVKESEKRLEAAEAEAEKLIRRLDVESERLEAKLKKGIRVAEAAAAMEYLRALRQGLVKARKRVTSACDDLEKAASRLGVVQAKLREKSAHKKAAEKYLSGKLKKEAAERERKEET